MRFAGGAAVLVLSLALALTGCDKDSTVDIADFVAVDNVPACVSGPVELAGDSYWALEEDKVAEWEATHQDPYGGTPQPQASMLFPDGAGGRGMLYRYADGTALFIASTGNRIYFADEEQAISTNC